MGSAKAEVETLRGRVAGLEREAEAARRQAQQAEEAAAARARADATAELLARSQLEERLSLALQDVASSKGALAIWESAGAAIFVFWGDGISYFFREGGGAVDVFTSGGGCTCLRMLLQESAGNVHYCIGGGGGCARFCVWRDVHVSRYAAPGKCGGWPLSIAGMGFLWLGGGGGRVYTP